MFFRGTLLVLKTFFGIPVEKGQYNLKCDLKICMTDSTSTEKPLFSSLNIGLITI